MASTKSALQFLSTVRHLRAEQIASQLYNRLRPFWENPEKFRSHLAPDFSGCRSASTPNIPAPGPQNNSSSDVIAGQLSFLNTKQHIGWPPDWNPNDLPKLWLYNLHYFEYLWALDYIQSKTLVSDWIDNYPLQPKQIGWEPYPTSLRLMNLCNFFFAKYQEQTQADTLFLHKLWQSIFTQAQWLTKHLERHLLGNHLFENGAALALVGTCFSGSAADNWFQTGTRILAEQIPEQILADGMHFERSPMYHSRITYLLAVLFSTAHQQLTDLVNEPLKRTIAALGHLIHPDGRIALLNDSAFDIYNTPEQLFSYVQDLLGNTNADCNTIKTGPFALPDAGYYGFRGQDGTYIICDAAPIGPDYMPGHAHADIFSFELSLKGHRVVVDSGVHDYDVSQTRQYCRSTKAHNTIEINEHDQCEMWAAFRVGRRGYPRDVNWKPCNSGFTLSVWHDGYRRLPGDPTHYRQFTWDESAGLVVSDKICASQPQAVVSRLHLHPSCKIEQLKDSTALLSYPAGEFKVLFSGKGRLSVENSYYCPQFGLSIANKALAFTLAGTNFDTGFQIEVM